MARVVLEYIDHKLRGERGRAGEAPEPLGLGERLSGPASRPLKPSPWPLGAQNPVARCIMCCFKCCLWCLEKFIKFLNRNAYIMVSPARGPPLLLAPRPPRPGDPDLPSHPDRHLREEFLCLRQGRLHAAHAERRQVSCPTWSPRAAGGAGRRGRPPSPASPRAGWWCWTRSRTCCCSSGSCWWWEVSVRAAEPPGGAGRGGRGEPAPGDATPPPQGSCPSSSSPAAWGWARTWRAAPCTTTGSPSW